MPLLSQGRFGEYQELFLRKVANSDMVIKIGIEQPSIAPPSGSFLLDFSGNNPTQVYEWYDFPALYDTNIDAYERDRWGLSKTETATVYISPLQLPEDLFPDQTIDRFKTLVQKFNGQEYHEFMVDWIEYLEPLYDSCIAIAIHLKDKIRG